MNSLVSIVIPVYNVEKYLKECVDSAINQTYKNIEIILVDDGSKDNSGKICDEYKEKDERVIVIHKENGGLSDARNCGMANANGEYIYFLDSDDYILENTISELLEKAIENSSDFVFFGATSFLDDDTSVKKTMSYDRKGDYGTSSGPEMINRLYNNGDFYTAIPLMFYRKSFIDKNNLEFYKGILHEDNLFSVQAFLAAEIVTHLNKDFYQRRIRDESIMTTPFSKRNFLGYSICIQELIPYYLKAQKNSAQELFLEKFLKERMNWTVNGYFDLCSFEQKTVNKDFLNLRKALSTVNFFGDWHTFLKSYLRTIYTTYRLLKKNKIK